MACWPVVLLRYSWTYGNVIGGGISGESEPAKISNSREVPDQEVEAS